MPSIARVHSRTVSLAANPLVAVEAWPARDFLRPVVPIFAAGLVATALAIAVKSVPPATDQPMQVEPVQHIESVASKGTRLEPNVVRLAPEDVVALVPQDVEPAAIERPVTAAATEPPAIRGKPMYGLASYYWQGTKTASGERFDSRDMTAAHRTLPFGTRIRVTSLETGRSVTVRINDRGPYIDGRIVDISRGAAQSLGMIDRGVTKVKLDVLQ